MRRPPSISSSAITASILVAFVVWTALVRYWPPIAAFDHRMAAPHLELISPVAQIASAVAILTWPGVPYAILLGIAVWAVRQRLRQLALALALTVILAWGGAYLLKLWLGRPRPEDALPLITASGLSYPSGHAVAIVAFTVGIGATLLVTRERIATKFGWLLGGAVVVLTVGVDRWLLSAHYISDIVGGMLYGALAARLALMIAGVAIPAPHDLVTEIVRIRRPAEPGRPRRCAVIYNPAKVTNWEVFRRRVHYELANRGWQDTLWLETTKSDPGRAQTARAVEEGVDLVLGAGGDGTIRVICAGLANSGIPFGLIPAGTGNLLAKNIGIPLDEDEALQVALDGADRPIDLVKLTIDNRTVDHFAVMAGIGIDAVIMEATNPDLKKAVGSAAYFVSAAKNAGHPALHATIQVDDDPPLRRRAHVLVIGNVGFLQANIPLIPDAAPDDGLLDVLIASPRGVSDWVKLTARVLTRQRRTDDQLDRITGRRVTITVEERDRYQLDGDTEGECNQLIAEVLPGALLLRSPHGSWPAAAASTPRPAIMAAEAAPADEAESAPVPEQQPVSESER
ncbi:diacylglycerol kinase family protein [Microlunatus sp. GCM10028923]|uniref:diacylglycerol kinase family protein n=1 Tax=Microlunatus sp. GCM10028923 TaxID=3273400 RepID=UPI00366D5B80